MARTIRRPNYCPGWVTKTFYRFIDPKTGAIAYGGHIALEGKERQHALHRWHGDSPWNMRPGKLFRQFEEDRHRTEAKNQLSRWVKNPDHPVQIRGKKRLEYWD